MFKHLSIKSRLIFVIAFLAVELIAGAVIGAAGLVLSAGFAYAIFSGLSELF